MQNNKKTTNARILNHYEPNNNGTLMKLDKMN